MALFNSKPSHRALTGVALASFMLASCSGAVGADPTQEPPGVAGPIASSSGSGRADADTTSADTTPPHDSGGDTVAPTSSTGSNQGGVAPSVNPGVSTVGSDVDTTSTPDTATSCSDTAIDPGPSPVLRLTRRQYLNTLTDVFGQVPNLSAAFTQSGVASGIGASQGDISLIEVEEFQRAAELIAKAMVTDDSVGTLAPCEGENDARTCASTFVTTMGTRLYRAPITASDDIERHLALFDVGATTNYRTGIELLLRGMLQSARFIYRLEFGTTPPAGATRVQLSDYEVATRLSYTLRDTLPDATLLAAAAAGQLSTPDGIERALTSMLESADDAHPVRRFLEELVHLQGLETLDKDPELFPEWTPELKRELGLQAQRFFDYVLVDRKGSLAELFTSDTVTVNDTLAFYYETPSDLDFGTLTLSEAAGILTLPALLALNAKPDESSPIYRGKFVRELLLCQIPPPPPPDIPPAPKVDGTASTRERLKQHEVDPDCSGCHQLLDPIGFAFEHYDAIGRYRETDGAEPVDARGELIAAGDISGPVDGVNELGALLATSQRVNECIARQWFRHVFSRLDTAADSCSVQQLVLAFRGADSNLNALPSAIVATDAFRYRRTSVPDASIPNSTTEVTP